VSRVDSPALRGTWLGTLLRFLNPIMRFVLATPFHWPLSHWFLLIGWTGGKSGKQHSTPVSHIRDDTGIWVTTGDRWPRFVIGNETTRVRLGGRWVRARAVPITDAEVSRRMHARLFQDHGWFGFLAGIPKRDHRVDEAAVVRSIAAGRQLLRIDAG
jgi:hypothetical protein